MTISQTNKFNAFEAGLARSVIITASPAHRLLVDLCYGHVSEAPMSRDRYIGPLTLNPAR